MFSVRIVCFALCLLLGTTLAFDNTIDFGKHNTGRWGETSEVINRTHTENPLTWEFGIGYIHNGFSAKQDGGAPEVNHSTSASSNGVDVFFNGNMYLSQRAGIALGLGLEFLPLNWQAPLYEQYLNNTLSANDDGDFLLSEYLTIGGFYDVHKSQNTAIRLFANAGIGLNFRFGGLYHGTITPGIYFDYFQAKSKIPVTIPLTLGARFIFAKSHGIEAVFKASILDMDYALEGYATPYTTTISRGVGFGLRYVYEFK